MSLEIGFQYLFWAVFVAIALSVAFSIVRYGGFKGAVFGADVERTVGEVAATQRTMTQTTLKVHVLSGIPDRAIGIELETKGFAVHQIIPVALSAAESKRLISILQEATSGM